MMFEQQPKESAKAFAAFKTYLDMGPERSLALVAAKLGKSKVMMEKWSRRFDWPARVVAHGGHLALVEREAAEAGGVVLRCENRTAPTMARGMRMSANMGVTPCS